MMRFLPRSSKTRCPPIPIRSLHLAAVLATLKLASNMCDVVPTTRPQWNNALDELPATPEKIPAFFFAHGRTFSTFLNIYSL